MHPVQWFERLFGALITSRLLHLIPYQSKLPQLRWDRHVLPLTGIMYQQRDDDGSPLGLRALSPHILPQEVPLQYVYYVYNGRYYDIGYFYAVSSYNVGNPRFGINLGIEISS